MASIPPPPHTHTQVEEDVVNLTTAKVQFSEDSKVMIDVSPPPSPPLSAEVCVYQLVWQAVFIGWG